MPATKDDIRVRDIHQKDVVAYVMGVPAGYAGEHPPVSRDNLPPQVTATLRDGDRLTDDEATWDDTYELKYTAYELHKRAQCMQEAWEASFDKVHPPLHLQPPEDRAKAWKKLVAEAKDLQSQTGLRGMPGYSRLSYFRFGPCSLSCVQCWCQ